MLPRGSVQGRLCTLYGYLADYLGVKADECICPAGAKKDRYQIPVEPLEYIEMAVREKIYRQHGRFRWIVLSLIALSVCYVSVGIFIGWLMWGG